MKITLTPRDSGIPWMPIDLSLPGLPRIGDTVIVRNLEGYRDTVYVTVTNVDWTEGDGTVRLYGDIDESMSEKVELDKAVTAWKASRGVVPA